MPATPGRRTVVTLDVPQSLTQQPEWTDDLSMEEIASTVTPPVQMSFHPGIGWQIEEYHETLSFLHETAIADDSVKAFTVPAPAGFSGVLSAPTYRVPDLLGVPAGDLRTGDNFYTKQIGAEATWDFKLTADQTAFPGPVPTALVPMDRIGVTSGYTHQPDEALCLRLEMLGAPARPFDAVATIMFTGVPGHLDSDPQPDAPAVPAPGDGAYALVLYANGLATLYERLSGLDQEWATLPYSWVFRKSMQWSDPQKVVGTTHRIFIRSDARLDAATGKWSGSVITFEFASLSAKFFTMVRQMLAGGNSETVQYRIPKHKTAQPTLRPCRVDLRRDVAASFQVSETKFRENGTLTCRLRKAPFSIFLADADHPVYVTVYGDIPTGTVVQIELYNQEDKAAPVACTFLSSTEGPGYFQASFTPIVKTSQYFAVVTCDASADGFKSPTIKRVTIYRPPVLRTSAPTPQDLPVVSSLSISGPGQDPSHETATFIAPDRQDVLADKLRVRSKIPILCKVFYDPGDPDLFSVLFRGRAVLSKWTRRGTRYDVYPAVAPVKEKGGRNNSKTAAQGFDKAKRWGVYQILCVGEWAKLEEKQTISLYTYGGIDSVDGQAPFLATTVLRDLFRQCGLKDEQFSLPESTVRMFVMDGKYGVIEPYTPILPIILSIAREYLNAYVVPDHNATNGGAADDTLGCWRVLVPPSPNEDGSYNYKCHFRQRPPSLGSSIEPGSYPDIAGVKQTFVRWGSATEDVSAPEGNIVIVDGAGPVTGMFGSIEGKRMRQVVYNYPAVDLGQPGGAGQPPAPDPTHPDYTDGQPVILYYQDPNLFKQEAMNFMARRIFDLCCHTKNWRRFEAPLVLITDATDTLQIRPRKLQFGDPVTYQEDDGTVNHYFVSSVNAKSGEGEGENSMAAYELFNIPALLEGESGNVIDLMYRTVLGLETNVFGRSV